MDAHTRAFGSFQVRASFEDGRFGPVFLAEDPASGRRVVIRTFTHLSAGASAKAEPLTAEQRDALLDALRDLCEFPLDHPSVARPISCGLEGDTPYFVHAFLDGIPADEYLAANGPSRLADLIPLITPAAAALDFAAAAGVTHGALGFRDIIIGEMSAGVSGFGLVQVLQIAGIDIRHVAPADEGSAPATETDIRALATITSQLLVSDDASRMRQLIEAPPETALGFIAALQELIATSPPPTTASASVDDEVPVHREDVLISRPRDDVRDFALREDPRDFDLRDATFAPAFAATTGAVVSPVASDRGGRGWVIPLTVAASLAVGLLSGFAAGVVVGRRDARPEVVAVSPPPQPTATAGQIFTDQTTPDTRDPQFQVPGSQVPSSAVQGSRLPSSEGSGVQGSGVQDARVQSSRSPAGGTVNRDRGTRNQERGTANREPGTGNTERGIPPSLWVESRPTGAAVYVDGQLVGRTPLLLGGISAGGHNVRLDMPGYQQWMTRVTVADSGRTRVAASLEQ